MENRFNYIKEWIPPNSRVLDLGCSDGTLLNLLVEEKKVTAMGVEIEEDMLTLCLEKGLNVFKEDIDQGLKNYGDQSFDYVILSQTLQQVNNPLFVLQEMLRVGKKAIVSVPNFGNIKNRIQLMFKGRMPVNKDLPYQWYNTPNIHFCTRKDFKALCRESHFQVISEISISGKKINQILPNLTALESLFLLRGKTE